jgi:hypothetical protein
MVQTAREHRAYNPVWGLNNGDAIPANALKRPQKMGDPRIKRRIDSSAA